MIATFTMAGPLTRLLGFILLSFLLVDLLLSLAHGKLVYNNNNNRLALQNGRLGGWSSGLRWQLSHGARNLSRLEEVAMEDAARKRSPVSPAYLVSPLSQRVLDVRDQLDSSKDIQYEFVEPGRDHDAQCLTLRSSVQVMREELHHSTGHTVRKCRGSVPLNRCEGACSSYTEPAVMSHSNLRQDCQCCNEGALRSFQVRLNECYATTSLNVNERLLRPPLDPVELSYMDIEMTEPIHCKCRQCRPFL